MSTDVTMLYEALYRLASKGSEDALFVMQREYVAEVVSGARE